mmetsp:Transcript_58198/g.162265  ORF Transcript_58198/g.162265 Transcript_58198/m.162265 type:complete len:257 (-) Transcript_58198:567-1337(-)
MRVSVHETRHEELHNARLHGHLYKATPLLARELRGRPARVPLQAQQAGRPLWARILGDEARRAHERQKSVFRREFFSVRRLLVVVHLHLYTLGDRVDNHAVIVEAFTQYHVGIASCDGHSPVDGQRFPDAWALHLQCHLAAIVQPATINLPQRRGGDVPWIQLRQQWGPRGVTAIEKNIWRQRTMMLHLFGHDAQRDFVVERRVSLLQAFQLLCELVANYVWALRARLAHFNEEDAHLCQASSKSLAAFGRGFRLL